MRRCCFHLEIIAILFLCCTLIIFAVRVNTEAIVYLTRTLDLCNARHVRSISQSSNGRDLFVLFDPLFGHPDQKIQAIITANYSSSKNYGNVSFVAQQSSTTRLSSFAHDQRGVSKVAALLWFLNSSYHFMWQIEDDV